MLKHYMLCTPISQFFSIRDKVLVHSTSHSSNAPTGSIPFWYRHDEYLHWPLHVHTLK